MGAGRGGVLTLTMNLKRKEGSRKRAGDLLEATAVLRPALHLLSWRAASVSVGGRLEQVVLAAG